MILADCGVGVVKVCLSLQGLPKDVANGALLHAVRDLAGLVVGLDGIVVVEIAPPEVKTQLEVWGPRPPSFPLLKALKRTFDPDDVLSPGRFIGGL
jgi:glycolate oxidase FAD binding subunit